ncbi:MAG: hypothetical protein ABIK65_12345 [Candidatus Eisenbacteria bacterium]
MRAIRFEPGQRFSLLLEGKAVVIEMNSYHDPSSRDRVPNSPDRSELVRKVAERIVGLGLAAPAIRFLESGTSRPAHGGRGSLFFGSLARMLAQRDEDRHVVEFLDDRETVASLILEIERIEEENREPEALACRRLTPNRRFGRIVRRHRPAASPRAPGGER